MLIHGTIYVLIRMTFSSEVYSEILVSIILPTGLHRLQSPMIYSVVFRELSFEIEYFVSC